jgi:hypothetical protein
MREGSAMFLPFLSPVHFWGVNAAMVLLNSVRTTVTVFGILSQCLWNAAAENLCYEARNSSLNFEGEPNYLSMKEAFSISSFFVPKILESNNDLLSTIIFCSINGLPEMYCCSSSSRSAIIFLIAFSPSSLNFW